MASPRLPGFRRGRPEPIYNAGMTAILCVATKEGLVIGADGMRVTKDGNQICDSVQKIFLANQPSFHGAHAWTNHEQIEHTIAPTFRFSEETQGLIESTTSAHGSLHDLLTRAAEEVYNRLVSRFGRWIDPRILPETEVTSTLFVGYLSGRPQGALLTFPHQNGHLSRPTVDAIEMPIGFPSLLAGSPRVLKEVWPADASTSADFAMSLGIGLVQGYLETCIAQRDTHADCRYIGGRIHLAKVTAEKADWEIPPK